MLSDGLYVRVSRRGDETRGLGHGGRRAAERHHGTTWLTSSRRPWFPCGENASGGGGRKREASREASPRSTWPGTRSWSDSG